MAMDAPPVTSKDITRTHLRRGRTDFISINAPTNGRAMTSLAAMAVSNQAASKFEAGEAEDGVSEEEERSVDETN